MHVFRAFKSADTPNTNMAEAGHSRNATRGAKNKSLATVAEEHIVECALLKSKLEMHESGTYKGGHCPTQRQKHTATFRRQRDRAAQFAKELEAGDINPRLYSTSSFVDPSSSHRAPKRTGISTSDDIGALSASSSSENESTQAEGRKTAKASFRKRKGRSKVFQKSLSMAKRTKSVTLTQIYDAGPTRKVFELLDGGRIRLIEISETPTCDCGMVSSRDICMHVIWVMLRKLNVNENDDIIQQKSIPVARVKKLLRSEEHAVSSGVTASLTSGVSAATTALPPAASTTAISGGFLPNSGSFTTSRALPPAVSTTAISSGFSNSFTSGGLLPNSGSSTTSTAIPAAYPHFPPHVYQSHQKMPWHNSNPFVIVPINNRIKKCAGCPFEFLDASGPTFTGLVVRHCEKDFYIDKTGHRMVGRETNRYYHCENGCLLNSHPYFSAALIRLEPGLQLNSFQLNHLQRALHVQFQ